MKNQPASRKKLHELNPMNEFTYKSREYRLIVPARRKVPARDTNCQVLDLQTFKAKNMNCNTLVTLKA